MGKYHYQIEKQETKTSGIVDLVNVKKTSSGGKKSSKVSNRQILEQILNRLDNVEDILKRHGEILERHSEILERHDQIFKRNNLK